jgi:NAD+ kinase
MRAGSGLTSYYLRRRRRILRVAQVAVNDGAASWGNLGRLGFLTELTAAEIDKKLEDVLAGEGWLEPRAMINIDLQVSSRRGAKHFHALNDVVMARGEIARIVHITAEINGHSFTTYRADGVWQQPPPVLRALLAAAGCSPPQSKDFVLTPIMPHLTMPVVLPVISRSPSPEHLAQATLSIDGHISMPLNDGDSIAVGQPQTRF